jgi:hypothetical protein
MKIGWQPDKTPSASSKLMQPANHFRTLSSSQRFILHPTGTRSIIPERTKQGRRMLSARTALIGTISMTNQENFADCNENAGALAHLRGTTALPEARQDGML